MHTGGYSREEAVDKVEKSGIRNYNAESNHRHEFRVDIYGSSWGSVGTWHSGCIVGDNVLEEGEVIKVTSKSRTGYFTDCTTHLFNRPSHLLHAETEFSCHATTVDILSATLSSGTAVIRTECSQDLFLQLHRDWQNPCFLLPGPSSEISADQTEHTSPLAQNLTP